MKITFVIYGLSSGGAERAVSGLANFWSNEHEVVIITLIKTLPFYKLDPKIKLLHCLEASKESTTIFKSIKDAYLRVTKIKQLLHEEKSDVVLSFMTKTNIYTIWAAKWLNIPCICSERANHETNKLPKFQGLLRNFSYRYLTFLTVQTKGNKKFYSKIIPEWKIKVIPNAIDKNLQNERAYSLKLKEKIILNVGAFRKAKAQELLINAFSQLKNANWTLVLLGSGTNFIKCKELAYNLGVSDKIEFLGVQKDVALYYNKASIFVFTSEHEGFPNALLEALYFGVPSISTNCPHGPADMITDGKNGFLVPVGDVKILADRMQELMNNIELQEKFRHEAIVSTKKYEIDSIAKQWMEVIKLVIE